MSKPIKWSYNDHGWCLPRDSQLDAKDYIITIVLAHPLMHSIFNLLLIYNNDKMNKMTWPDLTYKIVESFHTKNSVEHTPIVARAKTRIFALGIPWNLMDRVVLGDMS